MKGELNFEGRTVLVTGSGRNIGKAVLLDFAEHGANVIVHARSNRDEAEATADEARAFGVRAEVVYGEANDHDTIRGWREVAEKAFGSVDIYVSNAATRLHQTFDETSDEDWHFFLNQQLTASWYLAKEFVPGMRAKGWGRIIHMNGGDGWTGGATRVPHSTAKGALRTLTKSLAESFAKDGITVNDVSPGFTDTIRNQATHPGHAVGQDFYLAGVSRIPIGRQPSVKEISWACLVLASPRADAITGSVIHVDGGEHRLG